MDWIKELTEKDKKTNLRCCIGFHQYAWDWRKLCNTCIHCGIAKDDMFMKIRNFILFLACFLSVAAVCLLLISARANQMQKYETEHNCRYDYNELCYTQEQRPWLFND